jgi:hypothetical protein
MTEQDQANMVSEGGPTSDPESARLDQFARGAIRAVAALQAQVDGAREIITLLLPYALTAPVPVSDGPYHRARRWLDANKGDE